MVPDFQFLRTHEVKKSPGVTHDMIFGTWASPCKTFALGFFVFSYGLGNTVGFARGPVRWTDRNVSK